MSPNASVVIKTRRWLLVLSVLGALALPVAAWLIASRVNGNADAVRQIRHESATRERQFCQLVNDTHADRVRRLKNTRLYLKTPAGHEHTGLNDYVRVISLPQTVREVAQEEKSIPRVCLKYR